MRQVTGPEEDVCLRGFVEDVRLRGTVEHMRLRGLVEDLRLQGPIENVSVSLRGRWSSVDSSGQAGTDSPWDWALKAGSLGDKLTGLICPIVFICLTDPV